jgi:type IV fimbrial biogenesis protein FimT
MLRRQAKRRAGITLIEMMVVVAILAILVALAAPNLSELFIRNRLDTAANEFMTALNFARSEAIKRGVPVTVRRVSSTSKDWTQGWEIFVDINGNGSRDAADPREELLLVGQQLVQPLTLRSTQIVEAYVPFTASGRIALAIDDGPGTAGERAEFMLCHGPSPSASGRSRSRAVLVNSPGRVRAGPDNNQNGLPENVYGQDMTRCDPL